MKRMWSRNELKQQADSRVKDLVEGGTLENAKPVYCHPIYCSFVRDNDTLFTFTCLIFNNDATSFTKATFLQWCIDLFIVYSNASVMASGYVKGLPISRIKKHPDNPDTYIALESVNSNGDDNDYWSIWGFPEDAVFYDGVNKIN